MSTTVPPLRRLRIAFATVSPWPTTSKDTSAPAPPVRSATAAGTSTSARIQRVRGAHAFASASLSRSTSTAMMLRQPFAFEHLNRQQADHPANRRRPVSSGAGRAPTDGVHGDRHRFDERGALERQVSGSL